LFVFEIVGLFFDFMPALCNDAKCSSGKKALLPTDTVHEAIGYYRYKYNTIERMT
jgi:hypothetical protein